MILIRYPIVSETVTNVLSSTHQIFSDEYFVHLIFDIVRQTLTSMIQRAVSCSERSVYWYDISVQILEIILYNDSLSSITIKEWRISHCQDVSSNRQNDCRYFQMWTCSFFGCHLLYDHAMDLSTSITDHRHFCPCYWRQTKTYRFVPLRECRQIFSFYLIWQVLNLNSRWKCFRWNKFVSNMSQIAK